MGLRVAGRWSRSVQVPLFAVASEGKALPAGGSWQQLAIVGTRNDASGGHALQLGT